MIMTLPVSVTASIARVDAVARLVEPVELFGKRLAEIELKEPSGALYIKLGDPRILVFNSSGSGYWVEQPETIDAYFKALIVHDIGSLAVMNLICLEDAMALKGALFGFFTDAAKRTSVTPSTHSSSVSA